MRKQFERHRSIQRSARLLLCSIGVIFGAGSAVALPPDQEGVWEGPYCMPVQGTHIIHLHTGKLLIFPGHYDSDNEIEAWLWTLKSGCYGENPRDSFPVCAGGTCDGGAHDGQSCNNHDDCFTGSECFVRLDNEDSNLFCSGHSAMADGRILITGGHSPPFGNHVGLLDANIFDPVNETWSGPSNNVAAMTYKRWYPTCTTLPDGRILTVSGSNRRCIGGDHHGENCIAHDDCGGGSQPGTCVEGTCIDGDHDGDACVCNSDCLSSTGSCSTVEISAIPEVYDPANENDPWSTWPSASLAMPFYPFMFVLPDGTVFYAGVEDDYTCAFPIDVAPTTGAKLNTSTRTWSFNGDWISTIPGGSAVMYEPGKILKAGGERPTAVNGSERIDLSPGGSGVWQSAGTLAEARVRNNLTILADGTVLTTGGTSFGNREYDYSCSGGDDDGQECSPPNTPPGNPLHDCPVGITHGDDICDGGGTCTDGTGTRYWASLAELWDPENPNTWEPMDRMVTPRLYHSTAILIPNGRVIKAGGGQGGGAIHDYHTFEIFSPPYLFKGPRPDVHAVPDSIRYGDAVYIDTPDANSIEKVHLIRLAAATHGFCQDQRLVPLSFETGNDQILITGALVGDDEQPLNPNVAPPGYYMLFLVNGNGVPSIGEYVQVRRPTVHTWVEFAFDGVPEEGTFPLPFDTLAEGRDDVPTGGIVRIKTGSTGETLIIQKAMRIESFDGSAVIGVQ